MSYIRPSQIPRRPYAKRLPTELCRRCLLSLRVREHTRKTVHALAYERRMSVSEYIARLLAEHLAYVSRTRGQLPVIEEIRA